MIWLILASTCFALWRSRYDASLFCYFCAQLGYIPVTRLVAKYSGDTSTEYLWAYASMTALILVWVIWIAVETLIRLQHSERGAILAVVIVVALTHMVYLDLPKIHPYDWVQLSEAAILLWAGICVGYLSAYTRLPWVSLTLAVLWVIQACFRIGFILHLPSDEWLTLNWRVPPLLCSAAFTLIGLLSRPERHLGCSEPR